MVPLGSIANGLPGGPLSGDPQPVTRIGSVDNDTGDYMAVGQVFDAPAAFTLEA